MCSGVRSGRRLIRIRFESFGDAKSSSHSLSLSRCLEIVLLTPSIGWHTDVVKPGRQSGLTSKQLLTFGAPRFLEQTSNVSPRAKLLDMSLASLILRRR